MLRTKRLNSTIRGVQCEVDPVRTTGAAAREEEDDAEAIAGPRVMPSCSPLRCPPPWSVLVWRIPLQKQRGEQIVTRHEASDRPGNQLDRRGR